MSSASPQTIITNAAADINAVAAGETLSAEALALGLSHFNRMLGQMKTRRLFAFYVRSQSFAFGTSKQSYTIGPSGADFIITGDRPVKLDRAKLVLTASSPNTEIDLDVQNVQEYSAMSTPALPTTLPSRVYFQPTYPNGTLFPWPYPTTTSNQLKLYWWNQLNEIATAAVATVIDWPPGYEDALTWTLSERLCIPFGKPVPPDLRVEAQRARGFIQSMNATVPKISADVPSSNPGKGQSLSGFLSRNF